jgi:hypothetical protein
MALYAVLNCFVIIYLFIINLFYLLLIYFIYFYFISFYFISFHFILFVSKELKRRKGKMKMELGFYR